ncbi:MAG: cation diffusion facilitator family transporter [uncultured bacterium]|nr:MAG: cation diffusion facilitator family transporter [uncultured bacterium]
MENIKNKKSAALLSVFSNSFLIIAKLFVGIISGSVSIISEAVHSFIDLLAAILAFFSVKISAEPADTEHQYGHEKFEDLSGGIEGLLIFAAAAYIIYEALEKIKTGSFEHLDTTAGIIVMLASVIINTLVSAHLIKVAKITDSIALLADAQHLRADVYTSLGVLAGLLIIKFTGLVILDPLIAIIIAVFIIKTGYDLTKTAIKNLLDTSLPENERKLIQNIIKSYIPKDIIEFQDLKTRKAGAKRLIEFTLTVPTSMTIKEGHDLCDKIEEDLEKNVKNADVTIHLEPCNGTCDECILYHKDSLACHKLKFMNR